MDFGGDDGAHCVEPWRSDGTRMVKDVDPGGGNSNSWPGEELWITDGTPGGTLLVDDINP